MNQFRVALLDRNHKRELRACYVRAVDSSQAVRIGQAILGGRALVAVPYRPERDPAFVGCVRRVD